MVRSICAASLSLLVAVPATAQSVTPQSSNAWRIREAELAKAQTPLPAISVGLSGRIGFGIYGPKREMARGKAVIVRDVTAPRDRRAGLGFSLKF